MDRAGVSTASVYRRYRIVPEPDLCEALARMQAAIEAQAVGKVTSISEARGGQS